MNELQGQMCDRRNPLFVFSHRNKWREREEKKERKKERKKATTSGKVQAPRSKSGLWGSYSSICVCVREVWLIIKSKVFSFRRAEGHRHRQRKWKILKKQTDLLVYISMNYAAVQKVQ